MKHNYLVFLFTIAVTACNDAPQPEPQPTAIEKATAELSNATEVLAGTEDTCANGYHPDEPSVNGDTLEERQAAGRLSQEKWDLAAAEAIKDVSSAEEARIRNSLGAEFGIAPSEMNGWRDIYEARAAKGKARASAAKSVQEINCTELPAARARLVNAQAEVKRLSLIPPTTAGK